MAKRARASRSSHRPGGQGPNRAGRSAAPAPASPDEFAPSTPDELDTLIDADEAEMVTELTIDESAVMTPATGSTRNRRDRRRTRTRTDDLEARMAAENVWVRADLRRIALVSIVLLVALAVSWVLFVALDLLNLY